MKPIAIYGAGSFGRETLMLIRQINADKPRWEPVGFFDDNYPVGERIHDVPVIGDIHDLNAHEEGLYIVIAVGNPKVRKKIYNKIQNDLISFATLIHPSVQIEEFQHCSIGHGTIIAAGNILTTDIHIGQHVLLNMACTCGHDVRIGDFASIMPNCILSGEAEIGEECFIGAGAAIMNRVQIEHGARVGARETVGLGLPKIMR